MNPMEGSELRQLGNLRKLGMPSVTKIGSKSELNAYKRAYPNGWAVGILTYVRILPLRDFRQVPGRTLVCCAPNGAADSIEALARVWLTHPRGKKAGSYRLYYFPEPPPEVVAALRRFGYGVYTVPGISRTGGRGLDATSLFASRAPGTEYIYGRRRPSQDICYIGMTADMRRRDREHSWRFGVTEAVHLDTVESRLARTREKEWMKKFDAAGIPLYNDTHRSPGALRPTEPLVGTLLPLTA
jgi:hypothetical protein